MSEQLVKRLKSFFWRFGAYLLVAGLTWLGQNIGLLELPPMLTAFIAYVIGELTKYLNTGNK